MEDRPSRRVRTLVTRMAHRGLSANKIARALISMMVWSHDKLQSETGYIDARPHPPDRRNLLHRTAGPYIRVIRVGSWPGLIFQTEAPIPPRQERHGTFAQGIGGAAAQPGARPKLRKERPPPCRFIAQIRRRSRPHGRSHGGCPTRHAAHRIIYVIWRHD